MATPILMPALSPTMTHGNLVKWYKKEGDSIKSGMILADIETDKATMEIEAIDEGILGKIIIQEGSQSVPVQSVIAWIVNEGEDASSLDDTNSSTPNNKQPQAAPISTQINLSSAITNTYNNTNRTIASPLARRIAKEHNVDLHNVQGTGPKGRIVQKDIQEVLQSQKIQPGLTKPAAQHQDSGWTDQPVSTMRQVIATRLKQSKQEAPHFYLSIDCNMDRVIQLRKEINKDEQYNISINDFVVLATALTLKNVPALNVEWQENHIRIFHDVNVAVAVSIPGGLVTPVVRHTNHLSLHELSINIKSLATRAREGKLKAADYQGGTITISNLGMYGVSNFQAIINPPQAAILAVGTVEKRPAIKDETVCVANMMTCTLSVDHRAVDGADAAIWFKTFKHYIENPLTMLV